MPARPRTDIHAKRRGLNNNIYGAVAASMLSEVLLCASCGAPLRIDVARTRACCCPSNGHRLDRPILRYDPDLANSGSPEMRARDRQAHGYMMHSKLPTQIHRIRSFVAGLPE
jgi:hypothetical protein